MQKIIHNIMSFALLNLVHITLADIPATAKKTLASEPKKESVDIKKESKEPRIRFVDPQAIMMGLDEGRELAEKMQADFKSKIEALQYAKV